MRQSQALQKELIELKLPKNLSHKVNLFNYIFYFLFLL